MSIFGKPSDTKPAEPAPSPRPVAPSSAAPAPTAARGGGCVIGPKITIKGELTGDEDVLVEGSVEGQIRVTKDLRVGPGGSVKATVEAQSVIVSGEIIGNCHASNRVELQSTGRLTGDIRAPKIVIAEGAMFRGNSDMSGRRDEKAAAS